MKRFRGYVLPVLFGRFSLSGDIEEVVDFGFAHSKIVDEPVGPVSPQGFVVLPEEKHFLTFLVQTRLVVPAVELLICQRILNGAARLK